MAQIKIYVQCACGSLDLELIKKEAIQVKHMVDHVLTYRCRTCGKEKVMGMVIDGDLKK